MKEVKGVCIFLYFCAMKKPDMHTTLLWRRILFPMCVILLIFSGFGHIYAQETEKKTRTIDSAMALSPAYMPVYTADFPTVTFKPLQYHLVDTSIFHTSDFSPFLEPQNLYQTLGINGQAHKSVVFDYEREMGFTMIKLPFNLFFKQQKDLRRYNVQPCYTVISYNYGVTAEHAIFATHAQKIKNFEFAFNLTGLANKGYFLHQKVNMLNTDWQLHYHTKDSIYGLSISYILNHLKQEENGGLSDLHSFIDRDRQDENLTTSLSNFNVMFSNASSLINTHDVLFQQYVNLRDKKNRYYGTITHSFQFKKMNCNFSDYNLNNDFYQNRYYISTDTTRDSINYYGIANTLQWSNYSPTMRQSESGYFFRFAGGIQHEFVRARMPRYTANSFTLFARTSIRLFKVWDIYGNISYSFLKYIKNDAHAGGTATFAINRKHRHYIGFEANFYRRSPDFILTHYVGNHNMWTNTWKKQNILKLDAFYTIFDYKVSFNYFMLNNYVYLNSKCEPQVCDKGVNLVQLNLFAPLRVKGFYMDLNVAVQHSTQSCISVPLFAGKLYVAYQFKIFRNRLHIQLGGDLMYNTLYYGDAYNPLMHQFYHEDNEQVGNYLYFDLNLTLRVERIAFYVRGGNLLAGVFGFNYMTTPFYPMQGRNLELGITWRFYD